MGESRYLSLQDEFFVRTIKEMPFPVVKQVTENKLIHIPIDLVGNPEEIAYYILDKFDTKEKT